MTLSEAGAALRAGSAFQPLGDDILEAVIADDYAIIPAYLLQHDLERAVELFAREVPTGDEFFANPRKYIDLVQRSVGITREFPDFSHELQLLTLDGAFADFAKRFLMTPHIIQGQSFLWAKYAQTGLRDQPLHVDMTDTSLAYPSRDRRFKYLQMTLFLTDVTGDDGSMRILPRKHSPARPFWPSRLSDEEMRTYSRHERSLNVPPGTLLIYTDTTYHRGSAFRTEHGYRWSLQFTWAPSDVPWLGWRRWSRYASRPEMRHLLSKASSEQHQLLGMPPPDSPYWTEETRRGVAARYDIHP